MSWVAIVTLAVLAYGCKAAGLFVLGPRSSTGAVFDVVQLLPAALFAAIIVTNTFDAGGAVVIDARVVGLLAAVVASWRRAPFTVVVGVAMLATALARQLG